MRPNKENIISALLVELEASKTRKQVLTKICRKFQFTERTFDNYWKIAQERWSVTLRERQRVADEVNAAAEVDRLKKAILSKDEALEILSNTAKGTARQVRNELVIPSHNESINAIKTLGNILGWNAPTELDLNATINRDEEVEVTMNI